MRSLLCLLALAGSLLGAPAPLPRRPVPPAQPPFVGTWAMTRLVDVFKNSVAWGKLVIRGQASGTYRLPPLPDPETEEVD